MEIRDWGWLIGIDREDTVYKAVKDNGKRWICEAWRPIISHPEYHKHEAGHAHLESIFGTVCGSNSIHGM
jgi:hypothetical protein